MDSEQIQKQHYDRITREYEAHYDDPCSQRYRDKFFHRPMFEGVKLSGMNVVEAMCGSGPTTHYLLLQGAVVTGLDISQTAINSFLNRWPECQAVCASMTDSTLDSNSFDAVAIVGGIHHLHPCVNIAIEEICRILKPGGYLCFVEPHKSSLPDLIRRQWYKRDSLFANNEEAIDLEDMKREFASRFTFNREKYLGGIAYLLVLNSMVFRIPVSLKALYAPVLMYLESLLVPFQSKKIACFAVCQWQKR